MSDATPAAEPKTSEAPAQNNAAADLARALEANKALRAQVEEMQRKQAEAESKAAEAARKEQEQAGDLLGVIRALEADLAAERSEKATMAERVAAMEQAEAERKAAVKSANEARVAKLPEEYRALVPEGMAPDAVASHLDRIEQIALKGTERPAGGRAPSAPVKPPSKDWPQAFIDAANKQAPGMRPEVFAKTRTGKRVAERLGLTLPTAA